jgi:hypothetical protein
MRVRTRFPSVFVGHPFAGRFSVKKFRKIFKDLPFEVIYGNTDLQTKHLLTIMKTNVSKSDFSIFDLSDWNPNVALELGLAEGLGRASAKKYYIVLNTRRSADVPSDKRPEHFVDKSTLAEVHDALERAADVLTTVKGSPTRGRQRHR